MSTKKLPRQKLTFQPPPEERDDILLDENVAGAEDPAPPPLPVAAPVAPSAPAYIIVRASTVDSLTALVNNAVAKGYWPIGSHLVARHEHDKKYQQALVRKR